MSYNVSFSMLREFKKFMRGEECGLVFRAKYIDKTLEYKPEPGSPAHGGIWFEFICTGQKPRDNSTPEPLTKAKGELTALYAHLQGQKNNFLSLYTKEVIISTGKEICIGLDGHNFKGVFDVLTETSIRDIKTTGKIDDKFDGWGWNEKYPFAGKPEADQARMYIWLYWKENGVILPFFFDVFANTNSTDFKSIPCTMTEASLLSFEQRLLSEAELLKSEVAFGLEPKPNPMRCHKCPLADGCLAITHETECIEL